MLHTVSPQSLHTIFDTHLDHILVKKKLTKIQNFQFFDKKNRIIKSVGAILEEVYVAVTIVEC